MIQVCEHLMHQQKHELFSGDRILIAAQAVQYRDPNIVGFNVPADHPSQFAWREFGRIDLFKRQLP
jgi:hypothetical protein